MELNDSNDDQRRRRWKRGLGVAALLSTLAGGGVLAGGLAANAATATTSTPATGATSSGPASSGFTNSGAGTATPPALSQSGTVTAVGRSTVTIGSTTYSVSSTSDIDKNGESTLSSLAVGDAVTFSTVTSSGTTSIDKLHAGSEALDRPTGTGAPPSGTNGTAGSTTGGA